MKIDLTPSQARHIREMLQYNIELFEEAIAHREDDEDLSYEASFVRSMRPVLETLIEGNDDDPS